MAQVRGFAPFTSRAWSRITPLCLLFVATLGTGCSGFNPDLLTPPKDSNLVPLDGGGAGSGVDADSGPLAGTGGGGMGGQGAGADGGGAGSGGTGSVPTCIPNPDTTDQVCPEICPETCNNIDDDCDLKIDEDVPSDACQLAHAGSVCTRGKCLVTSCVGDFRDCDGKPENGCEASRTDLNNCGQCGNKCTYVNGQGACVNDKCAAVTCANGWDDCDSNPRDCEQSTDVLDNCTGCGLLCENVDHASPSCETGICGPGLCETDYGDCDKLPGTGCEQLLNTNEHCTGCDIECAFAGSTADCSTGTCLAAGCGTGFGECSGTTADGCESTTTPERCGGCTNDCTKHDHMTAATCVANACSYTCEAGFKDCKANLPGCETSDRTLDDCGACGVACEPPNALGECTTGTCKIASGPDACDPGFDDCNGLDSDGCERPIDTTTDCGACNSPCTGGKVCSGGTCGSVNCNLAPHNTADCSGTRCANCDTSNDGDCETDLDSNVNNCGSCGNKCAFNVGVTQPHSTTPVCSSSGCRITCNAGFGDCNGDYRDGCEAPLNTTSNCDGCNQPCTINNATSKCTTLTAGHYQCEVATCDTDFSDCNNDKTSCESALNTTTHCGDCATSCNLSNAVEACTGSTGNWDCTVAACTETYYKDCNTMSGDGCEIDSRDNVANCGACGNNCTTHSNVTDATCAGSACAYTCSANFSDCLPTTPGCETDIRTLANCGGCGTTCSRANATATCATGNCAIGTCSAGFGKCDASDANGCESLKTVTDCGACGTPCTVTNGTGTCSTGSCAKQSCNAGFDDCNGGLDCERDVTAPGANETGGMGPCMPDTGCTLVHNATTNHDYYFCSTARDYDAARTQCKKQRFGDLVRIDDDAENTFVKNNLTAAAWIGANDSASEGAWRWSSDTLQFWSGLSGGAAVGGLFNKWNAGEPNDAGGEDCAQIIQAGATAGLWNDLLCTNALPFVCEVQTDACPADVTKQSPMQCGCGVPDVHSDADGAADCVDGCPLDASKTAAGQCGCGMPDVQSDADGIADCLDACPLDSSKSANSGACGCGIADTNTDGDAEADCNDACDYDGAHTAVPCAYSFTPTNFDPAGIFTGAPNVTCGTAGTTTFDTNAITAQTVCGATITPVIRTQAGGPELWILPMNSLSVASGVTLRFTGGRPVVLAVANDASVSGTLDVSAQSTAPVTTPGAGGNVSCAVGTGQGADGTHDADGDDGDGGGGGGGFGLSGANGGNGDGGSGGAAAGVAVGSATLSPLRGGCRGGANTAGGNVNGGGAGGGAIQLTVGGRLTLGATAVLAAAGSGGLNGGGEEEGGGGGGSGGAVFLEANLLSIDANAWITANGGGGSAGTTTNNSNGGNGADGAKNATTRASGGAGGTADSGNDSDSGAGGLGGASSGVPTVGANASARGCLLILCGASGSGGGGGGGGVGRVRIHGITAGCSVPNTPRQSPAASVACP